MADYPGEYGFGGLGYNNNNANTNPSEYCGENGGAAGNMLKLFMSQCLAYHEEQQQHQHQHLHADERYESPAQAPTAASHPEAATTTTTTTAAFDNVPQTIEIHHDTHNTNADVDEAPLPPPTTAEATKSLEEFVEEGRSRANAILEKFRQITRDHGGGVAIQPDSTVVSSSLDMDPPLHATTATTTTSAALFRQKRQAFLEQEKQRKHQFLVKNLQYVAQREQQRLSHQIQQLHQAKQWEDQVQQQYQHVLEERKRRLTKIMKGNAMNKKLVTSQAGIGTRQRSQVEHEKNRQGHAPMTRHLQQQDDPTVAIYVSGIPVDDQQLPQSSVEQLMQQLFSSYGNLRKIHLYRNKQTGALKGDALVVYQLDHTNTNKSDPTTKMNVEQQTNQLIQCVCSQMNGAELPGGAILQVQLADSNYNKKKNSSNAPQPPPQQQPSAERPISTPNNHNRNSEPYNNNNNNNNNGIYNDNKNDQENEEEDGSTGDLDDFFESLT